MKKKLLYISSLIMLVICCVFSASAWEEDRPYNAEEFSPEYYKIIDGVVYHKRYNMKSKKYYYEITDFFATQELAEKAKKVTNLRSEIDGIPVTVLATGEYARRYYPNITKVVLPDSITVIGEGALSEYSGVTTLKIPDSVEEIGEWAFAGMSSLKIITIPKKVRHVPSGLFSRCEKLSKVSIKGDVYAIGSFAFSKCTSLKNITLPKTVSFIGGQAFAESGLTSIVIPVRADRFGDYSLGYEDDGPVFKNCKKLTKVVFADAEVEDFVLNMDEFSNCTSLEKVYFPKSAKKIFIGEDAFSNCTKLTKVCNKGRVTSIGDGAFSGCKSLKSFTISSKVNEIGQGAFYGCTKLEKVTVNSKKKAPAIGKDAFGKTTESIKFVAKNRTAAKSWKSALKKADLKKMKVCYETYV